MNAEKHSRSKVDKELRMIIQVLAGLRKAQKRRNERESKVNQETKRQCSFI